MLTIDSNQRAKKSDIRKGGFSRYEGGRGGVGRSRGNKGSGVQVRRFAELLVSSQGGGKERRGGGMKEGKGGGRGKRGEKRKVERENQKRGKKLREGE